MTSCRSFIRGLAVLFLVIVAGSNSHAEERIKRYVSTVEVAGDGTLSVTETITVKAEGDKIERGIFRDFPLQAEGPNGRLYEVGFKLLSVKQDGQPAPHFTRRNSKGIRIYIGEEHVLLEPGDYTYTIEYETDRQIRFFDDHDEVYWNATGNEWAFPIDEVIARIVLPKGVKATGWTAFTGRRGETGKDFEAHTAEDGREVIFSTTKVLWYYSGLTVAVKFPKGAIRPPSEAEQFRYFLSDYRSELIGGVGISFVLFYYLLAWWFVGRDPHRGVVFPRFKPPTGISPALSTYIANRGFAKGGWVALSAACLNLAVKKRLRLKEDDGDVTLTLTAEKGRIAGFGLPKGEAVLESYLSKRKRPLKLDKRHGKSIITLGSKFRSAIEKESRNVFFRSNRIFLIVGVLLSLAAIVALLVYGTLQNDQSNFVIIFMVFSIFASFVSVSIGRDVIRVADMKLRIALIFGIFGVAIFAAAAGAFQFTGGFETVPVFPFIAAALIALNILFFFLMGAPTVVGRQALDEIEGLRLYLTVAEQDRLNMSDAPDMSTGHFEELLPYAVALGVERPWTKAFEGWLATAAGAAAAASYHPNWYSGRTFDARDISDSIGSTASSMAGSFRSSLPAPKSSSSGFSGGSSGGSSGGGGGGGGGGGW
ncbi:DUF2207 domain-containing protein [Roseibium marinum]|uniref:Putative membrane protein DUF2207 n=1 Tax=Roseibium marinum TaxID=281252 RepID=A0A2S3V531_9HYPH|nr:DUF2207 domain-containing protein [Roseibium marinum]POF34779.1 putative membrane protein DUF2207 [Roseibium marinum]